MTLTVCFLKRATLLFRFADDTSNDTGERANTGSEGVIWTHPLDLKHPCASNPCRGRRVCQADGPRYSCICKNGTHEPNCKCEQFSQLKFFAENYYVKSISVIV